MRRRARPYAITVVAVVLASACSCSALGTRLAPGSNQAGSASHRTTTTLRAPTTAIPSQSSSTTNAPSRFAQPTTIAAPQPCRASAFLVRASTGQTSYAIGEPVPMTVTISNTGPTCTGIEGSGPCDEGVAITGESDQLVWVSNPGPYACPAMVLESVPSSWRDSAQLTWSQVECPEPGAQCTQAQVPPGNYSLVASWTVGQTASRSPSLSITISPSS